MSGLFFLLLSACIRFLPAGLPVGCMLVKSNDQRERAKLIGKNNLFILPFFF